MIGTWGLSGFLISLFDKLLNLWLVILFFIFSFELNSNLLIILTSLLTINLVVLFLIVVIPISIEFGIRLLIKQ